MIFGHYKSVNVNEQPKVTVVPINNLIFSKTSTTDASGSYLFIYDELDEGSHRVNGFVGSFGAIVTLLVENQ